MIRRGRNLQLLRGRIGLGEPPIKGRQRYCLAYKLVFNELHLNQGVDVYLPRSTRSPEVVRLVVHCLVVNHPSPGTKTSRDRL
jgi:hypothetical protein